MAVKSTGISHNLIIHPGETIADILEDRGISQLELAISTGVTPAYVSKVISGKKGISAKFAYALECALDVPKTFWLNLQANYEAELLEADEINTITDAELEVKDALGEVISYLRKKGTLPGRARADETVLSLRKALRVSNLSCLDSLASLGNGNICRNDCNLSVLGAWVRLCQIHGEQTQLQDTYSSLNVDYMVNDIKSVMIENTTNVEEKLTSMFARYGIDFLVMKSFKSAPVNGYIANKNNEKYQMVVAPNDSYVDTFWFTVCHMLNHIVKGHVGKNSRAVYNSEADDADSLTNEFVNSRLISQQDYRMFVENKSYDIESINRFAASQNVLPDIVIRLLQENRNIPINKFNSTKVKYKWAE